MKKKIFIASDHAGYDMKTKLNNHFSLIDLGTNSKESVDYPDFAHKLTKEVLKNKNNVGILICGTGVGMSIVLNRTPGVRAAVCSSPDVAELARRHNDANILVLGARVMEERVAVHCLDIFFETSFEGGRHARRVGLIDNSDNSNI